MNRSHPRKKGVRVISLAEMMDSVGEDKVAAPWWAHVALTLEPDLPLVLPHGRQAPQRHTGRPPALQAPPPGGPALLLPEAPLPSNLAILLTCAHPT